MHVRACREQFPVLSHPWREIVPLRNRSVRHDVVMEGSGRKTSRESHFPVLELEVVRLAAVQPGNTIVDGTFGAGGHARVLSAQLDGNGRYIAIDQDASTRQWFNQFQREFPAIHGEFVLGSYAQQFNALMHAGVSADVVILDVGVSSMQLDEVGRGFSYSVDAPLDMRMNPTADRDAATVVNTADEDELVRIFREFGEERYARRIARQIVGVRDAVPFTRTGQLVEAIRSAIPAAAFHRDTGHPARRVFQALRIEVNRELEQLSDGLDAAYGLLADGGRLLVISFQSLEDRIVKQRFRQWCTSCTCPPDFPVCMCDNQAQATALTRKPITASEQELHDNSRSAPAKLRGIVKVAPTVAA